VSTHEDTETTPRIASVFFGVFGVFGGHFFRWLLDPRRVSPPLAGEG